MDNLNIFLHPEQQGEEEVVISDRFKDENGDPVKFRIRPLSQEENERIIKACTITSRNRSGQKEKVFDDERYRRMIVVNGTVYPDFQNKELCDGYGVIDPLLVPSKMLLVGEYSKLADAIATLSKIGEDVTEEAKN